MSEAFDSAEHALDEVTAPAGDGIVSVGRVRQDGGLAAAFGKPVTEFGGIERGGSSSEAPSSKNSLYFHFQTGKSADSPKRLVCTHLPPPPSRLSVSG